LPAKPREARRRSGRLQGALNGRASVLASLISSYFQDVWAREDARLPGKPVGQQPWRRLLHAVAETSEGIIRLEVEEVFFLDIARHDVTELFPAGLEESRR